MFLCDLHKSLIALFGAKACENKSGMSGQGEDCKIHISQQTAYHFEETMNAASTNTQEVHKCCEIHKDRKRNSSFQGQ